MEKFGLEDEEDDVDVDVVEEVVFPALLLLYKERNFVVADCFDLSDEREETLLDDFEEATGVIGISESGLLNWGKDEVTLKGAGSNATSVLKNPQVDWRRLSSSEQEYT